MTCIMKCGIKLLIHYHTSTVAMLVKLTHWGRVTHICVGNLTIIGSDNGLSPGRRQAIIWTNAGILLIGPLGTNFSEISIEILIFSFKKMRLKVSSAKWRPFCLGLNVLNGSKVCVFPFGQQGHFSLNEASSRTSGYKYHTNLIVIRYLLTVIYISQIILSSYKLKQTH